jgi:hypothetical protein
MELEKRIFNYRLSRARRIVENAFGILSNRFQVFKSPIALCPDKVEVIVFASICLHNMLRSLQGSYYIPSGSVDYEDTLNELSQCVNLSMVSLCKPFTYITYKMLIIKY